MALFTSGASRATESLMRERVAAYAARTEDTAGQVLVAQALKDIRERWAPRTANPRRLVAPAAPAAPPAA